MWWVSKYFILLVTKYTLAIDVCLVVTPVTDFKLKDFCTGRLFEIARYSSYEIEKKADCAYFDLQSDGADHNFTGHEVLGGKKVSYSGKLKQYPGKEDIGTVIDTVRILSGGANFTYHILLIDYEKYALPYYCIFDSKTNTYMENAWILSRSVKLAQQDRDKLENFIKNSNFLDSKNFVWNHFTHEICMIDL